MKIEESLAVFHLIQEESCVVGCTMLCRPGHSVIIMGCGVHSTPEIALPILRIIFLPIFKFLRTEEKTGGGQQWWLPQTIIVTKSSGSRNNLTISNCPAPPAGGDLAAGREMIRFFLEVWSLGLKWVKSWRTWGFQK